MRDSDPISLAVAGLGIAAAVLLLASLFAAVVSVDVGSGACRELSGGLADRCELSGFERHSVAMLLIGLLAAVMAFGAGVGRSRPAAAALVALGLIGLAITLFSDLHEAGRSGLVKDFASYNEASANKGAGLWLELLGSLAAVAAGSLRLARPDKPPGA